jgi:hypothetical protein
MATLNQVMDAIVAAVAPSKPEEETVNYFAGPPFAGKLETRVKALQSLVNVYPYNTEQRISGFLINNEEVLSNEDGVSSIITEISRQKKWFQINIWSPTYQQRDAISEAIKVTLDQLLFLTFADQSQGHIQYVQSYEDDTGQEMHVYRRMLIYTVEYATTLTEDAYDACLPTVLNQAGEVVDENATDGSDVSTTVLIEEIT